jgi:hypothetical protein
MNMNDIRIRAERLANQLDDTAVAEFAQLVNLSN